MQPPVEEPHVQLTGCEAVRAEVSKYPGWDANIMTAISQSESSTGWGSNRIPCDVNATGDKKITYTRNGRTYGYSLSVLQVRILEGREHCDVHDLAVNVRCAYEIYKNQGYKAWSDYKNGKYRRYL